MRLNRLELIRYGRFQDAALDFGPPPEGRPDVTVVYGGNEAGKSTAFTAWLDFLFGFRGGSQYAFRFDRKDMLVGAVLETPDGVQALRRSAASAGSLTDANGHVIAEARLAGWLHGLDREAYRTRFSLNDTILREGGAEIARAQGDLGQLLHAGSSGLAGLSEALAKVEAEVEGFHRKGGRKTVANEGRNRLRELEAAVREARLDPRGFDRLTRERDEAEAAFAAAQADLAAARLALGVRAAAEARRRVAGEVAALEAELAGFPDGPDLPAEAVARVSREAERLAQAEAAVAKARAAGEAAAGRLAGLDGDPEGQAVAALLLTIEAAVFGDGEPLLPRVLTAQPDLAKRREERAAVLGQMRERAARLAPGTPPEAVVLPRGRLAEIREAADAVRTARAELAGQVAARRRAEADRAEAVAPPEGLAELEEALAAWHRLPAGFEEAVRAAEAAEAALAEAEAGLPADWRATVAAGLPEPAEVEALAEALRAAEARRGATAELCEEARRAWQAAVEGRDAAAARPDVVLDAEIAGSRALREAAWSRHRAGLDAESAAGFEAAMRADDGARERHAASAEGRLRVAQLAEEAARRGAALAAREAALAEAGDAADAAAAGVAAMAGRLGLPAGAPARALPQRRDRLQAAWVAATRAAAARAVAEALARARAERLTALRAAVGEACADDRLPAVADRRLGELRRRQAAAEAWREAGRAIDAMRRSEAEAAGSLAALEATLAARLAGSWGAGLDAERVLALLPEVEALAGLAAEAAGLGQRIEAMEAAIAAFAPMAADLAARLGRPAATQPAELVAAARARAGEAATALREREAAREALALAAQALREAEVDAEAAAREIAAVLAGQGDADAPDPVERVGRLARRDALRARRARAEAEWEAAGRGFAPEALAAEEAEAGPARGEALQEALETAEAMRDARLEARSRAADALAAALGGEGGAAPDQERAALVEALRGAAREAAARQFGLMAARSALRRFRQSHRGAMLEATEQAFAHITGGEWPRLDTERQGASERLVGIRGGEPVAVGAMSTGTQGQLYLALRIAGHAAFVAAHGPLPFVTDDIHETFDDGRARAAFELAAAMGARGQAILFTHHRHLVALAREAVPGIRVLELG